MVDVRSEEGETVTCSYCGSPLPAGAMFCGECGRSVSVTRANLVATPSAPAAEEVVAPVPAPIEPEPAERYILQFSTGESVTVTGSGLVGRNPSAEPGEYVDQLVTIVDPGKSVSKTHLEFGQEGGALWISDRFSGNGSGIRLPDLPRQHCDAGKRYPVPRGARVDIGDQFFIVS